jgi:molybdopterin synthase sulfur carrier subunit
VRVRVLYFAAVRDLAHRAEEDVDLPDGVRTVADFAAWVGARHAGLAARMGSVRIARNEAFAAADEALAAGDVLALIPPVAGG